LHRKPQSAGNRETELREAAPHIASQEARDRKKLGKTLDETMMAPTVPTEKTLGDTSIEDLQMTLKKIRDPAGYSVHGQVFNRYGRIILIVEHLIKVRGLPADRFMFECMMDAMIDPQGSAEGIRVLFKEMHKHNIFPSETICRSALAALAVHPDYALRQQVLDTMKRHWFRIDTADEQNIILGMLRDGQHELAYDKLMGLIGRRERIDLWFLDIFVFVFGHEGYLDEMLQVLYERKRAKGTDKVAMNLIYYALDQCSSASHYQGTAFAWNAVVRNGQLKPSDGILENVLATAAREGDVELATEVHSMISKRSRVQIHHYEALVEAFARDKNIAGALRILSIMEQSGLTVFRENTRAVYEALRQDRTLLADAETILRDMANTDRVPMGAISVVLEAKAKELGSEAASELYDDVQRLSGREPSATMIQDMIINSSTEDKTRAFLDDYKEKISVHENPPARLPMPYNKLISACLDFKELDLAMRFAHQTLDHGGGAEALGTPPPWLGMLTEAAIGAEDRRIWEVFDKLKKAGNKDAVDSMRKMLKLAQLARRVQDKNSNKAAAVNAFSG
jgi:hypothetical protein